MHQNQNLKKVKRKAVVRNEKKTKKVKKERTEKGKVMKRMLIIKTEKHQTKCQTVMQILKTTKQKTTVV